MRTLKYILCVLLLIPMVLSAQSNKNLGRYRLGVINWQSSNAFQVKPGEFKVYYDNYKNNSRTRTYDFFVIVRDKNDEIKQINTNNNTWFEQTDSNINLYRAGYNKNDFVYIEERNTDNGETEAKKYYLHVNGSNRGPFDKISEILPDGFIYKNSDIYTFKKYDDIMSDAKNYCILEEMVYDEETIRCFINNDIVEFKPKDHVDYYKSPDGNYYLVYNDRRMDNTLLVVNGFGYELDGSIDDLKLKFSHNGKHWIVSCQNYVMVDGVIVVRISGKIKYAAINNDGKYAYVIKGNGFNDKVYINDDVLVNGVEVKSLTVDEKQKFNYIIRNKKGYFYGIDNDLRDFDDNMFDYYYPDLFDGSQVFTVKSTDGKHTLVYSYEKSYILIDNSRLDCKSIPHYATWLEDEHCFVWNTIEDLDLMLYKYVFDVRKRY